MNPRRGIKPEDLMDAKDAIALAALALGGQFDDKIAELRLAKKELEDSQLIQRTLAEAEQIKHAAVQFAESERSQVVGIVCEAEAAREELLVGLTEAKVVLAKAQQEKDATAAGWMELEREQLKREAGLAKAEADLRRRVEMHGEKEASLAGEYDKLRILQDKLKTRLAKLETV